MTDETCAGRFDIVATHAAAKVARSPLRPTETFPASEKEPTA